MHDECVTAIQASAILFATVLDRFVFCRLQSRMEKRFDAAAAKLDSEIDLLRKEMQQQFRALYFSSVQQDARIGKLEKQPILATRSQRSPTP